jgi:hypothetical protein
MPRAMDMRALAHPGLRFASKSDLGDEFTPASRRRFPTTSNCSSNFMMDRTYT